MENTLLQIICGILRPTFGAVAVNGRISSLLELGAGFSPEFTGRQNVYINGAILGLKNREIEARFDEIVAFADIGEFIDQPIKTYSSGMYVRLAFAVQACLEPDILVVDEVLSVGDLFFQQKCHARMQSLLKQRSAIVLVSHDMAIIEKYSSQVLLLDNGRSVFLGHPNETVERYYQIEHSLKQGSSVKNNANDTSQNMEMLSDETDDILDWPKEKAFLDLSRAVLVGDQDSVRCTGVALCNSTGEPCTTFRIGESAYFYFEFEYLKDSDVPIGGIVLTNKMNINIHGKSSLQHRIKAPGTVSKGTRVRFRQTLHLDLESGEYSFQVGLGTISADDYTHVHEMDNVQLKTKFRIILRVRQAGIITIYMNKDEVSPPFYGLADLKGDSALSILNSEKSEN